MLLYRSFAATVWPKAIPALATAGALTLNATALPGVTVRLAVPVAPPHVPVRADHRPTAPQISFQVGSLHINLEGYQWRTRLMAGSVSGLERIAPPAANRSSGLGDPKIAISTLSIPD